jgi:hypothetical protein
MGKRKNFKAEFRKPEILENYYQVIIREGIEALPSAKLLRARVPRTAGYMG